MDCSEGASQLNEKDNADVEDDVEDDMDLDAALASLDIDKDFGMSFLENKEKEGSSVTPSSEESLEAVEENQQTSDAQINHYHQLYERDEIFSRHYKPSRMESDELNELGIELQAKQLSSMTKKMFHASIAANLTDLFNPDANQNKNILLKRGKLRVKNGKKANQGEEARLIFLFTHAFILAKEPPKASGIFEKMLSSSSPSIEQVYCFHDVEWIKDLWQLETVINPSADHESASKEDSKETYSNSGNNAFLIHVKGQESDLRFDCESLEEKQSWLAAWERVLIQNHLTSINEARPIGWQHQIVQTSLYTAAVTGKDFYAPYYLEKVNLLDQYNKLSPLHYAVIHNHIHVIQHLIDEFRADIELLDEDLRTPMYYGKFICKD